MTPVRLIAFAGSLRQGSCNRGLLRAAIAAASEDVTVDVFDLIDIPFYNGDVEKQGMPEIVADFRARIQAADGVLIACPEYNYSVTGVLKNAIDWASRSVGGKPSPFNEKPLAILGTGGRMGTARSQYHLRQIAVFLNMHVLNKPEMMVDKSWERFDVVTGDLKDEATAASLKPFMEAVAAWTRRHIVDV